MLQGIWRKILLGLGIIEEEKDEMLEEEVPGKPFWKRNNIVEFPSRENNLVLVVKKPLGFEEVENMGEHLKMKRAVVVNLEEMEAKEATKIIDFLSGVTFGINGHSQKIARQTFVFVPAGVTLEADFRNAFQENKDTVLQEIERSGTIKTVDRRGKNIYT